MKRGKMKERENFKKERLEVYVGMCYSDHNLFTISVGPDH